MFNLNSIPDRSGESTPQSRTGDTTRCAKRVNEGGLFRVASSRDAMTGSFTRIRVNAEPSTNLGRLIAQMSREGLAFGPDGIRLMRDAGETLFVDGVPMRGPCGCDECCDEFDDFARSESHQGQVIATYNVLELDLRDETEPDVTGGPEVRALCNFCADSWARELAELQIGEVA